VICQFPDMQCWCNLGLQSIVGFFLLEQGKIFCACSCMVHPAAKTEAKGFVWAVDDSNKDIGEGNC